MSKFEVLVEKVAKVEKHPNADRLSIVTVRGFQCISANVGDDNHPRYKEGDFVIYVPQDTIVPEYLLRKGWWDEKNNKGVLSGRYGDRVKMIKLRGLPSLGILYSVDLYSEYDPETDFCLKASYPNLDIKEGLDVTELLGFKKYEPVIPTELAGEVTTIPSQWRLHFDIENYLKFPNKLENLLPVVMTEKLHGTFTGFGYIRGLNNPEVIDGEFFAFSKGLGSQGMVFKDNEKNANNVYMKIFKEHGIKSKLMNVFNNIESNAVWILGETYGRGIQDLQYSEEKPTFRCFDIVVEDSLGRYFIDADMKYDLMDELGLDYPPILYRGPFDKDKMEELSSGKSALDNMTIREGVVITPMRELTDPDIGRLILKRVSSEYLTRKGDTTEYQ